MSKTVEHNRPTIIYVLKDPRFNTIRYVGKTVKTLQSRLDNHLNDAKRCPNRYVCKWIKSLVRLSLIPIIEEVDSCCWGESQNKEIYWISKLKQEGCRLTNLTVGGEGNLGGKASPETIRKRQLIWEQKARPVYQYKLTGEFVALYRSAKKAAKELGCRYSNIVQVCMGAKKSHFNYVWSFDKVDNLPYKRLPVSSKKLRKIDCFTLNNTFIKTYNSFEEAARELKVCNPNIHKVVKGIYKQTGGYIFKLHNV